MRRHRNLLVVLVALLVAAAVGVGCLATASRAIEPAQLGGPYQVQIYRGGRPVRESTLAPGSPDERAVAAWLLSHRDGWRPSLVTYAPVRMVRGDGFNLNLLPGGLCVLNYSLSDNPQEVVRQVAAKDAESLVAATGGE